MLVASIFHRRRKPPSRDINNIKAQRRRQHGIKTNTKISDRKQPCNSYKTALVASVAGHLLRTLLAAIILETITTF